MTDSIRYRAAHMADVPEMVEVYLESLRDMRARHGVPPADRSAATMTLAYQHVISTGVFRVAESKGRIVAIAGAAIRDHLWFLSAFWTRPGFQGRGVGMPLLRQTHEEGAAAGATVFFTWASPDRTALFAYMKLGMLPSHGIFVFEGAPGRLPPVPTGYEAAALEESTAGRLDLAVRGTRREVDHRFWSGPAGLVGRQVRGTDELVGYYYLSDGKVGPAAWTSARDAEALLILAAHESMAVAGRVGFAIPGVNHVALRFAVASGLQLVSVNQFMTSAAFGDMQRYLPSGPLLY